MSASAHGRGERRSTAEWVTTGVALAIVLAIAALIAYDWLTTPPTPTQLEVQQPEPVRAANGQFYVPFELTNTGANTAEAVRVLAELTVDDSMAESGEQEFAFVGGGETVTGAFVFSTDPSKGELVLRVESYQEP